MRADWGVSARESDAVKLKKDLMRRYTTAKVIEFAGPTGYWVRINPKFRISGRRPRSRIAFIRRIRRLSLI